MNVVTLIGNLTREPELREVGEHKVCSFGIAVDRPGKDKGADFINVQAWNGQGEAVANHLTKGARVGVTGSIRSRTWDKDDGTKGYATEVNASRVDFLSAPKTPAEAPPPPSDDDIPF